MKPAVRPSLGEVARRTEHSRCAAPRREQARISRRLRRPAWTTSRGAGSGSSLLEQTSTLGRVARRLPGGLNARMGEPRSPGLPDGCCHERCHGRTRWLRSGRSKCEKPKSPALQGLPMRRRGLEPPPGYPGPGPQPGNSTVISVRCVPDRPYRPGARTIRTHGTIWMLPRMLPRAGTPECAWRREGRSDGRRDGRRHGRRRLARPLAPLSTWKAAPKGSLLRFCRPSRSTRAR
jgi:hypothetical protein